MDERIVILDFMRMMTNAIIAVEAIADLAVEMAAEIDADGQRDSADVLRMMACDHRVTGLALQGKLVAACEKYALLICDTDVNDKT